MGCAPSLVPRSMVEQEVGRVPPVPAPMNYLDTPKPEGGRVEEQGQAASLPATPTEEQPRLSAKERWASMARGRAILRAEKESVKVTGGGMVDWWYSQMVKWRNGDWVT